MSSPKPFRKSRLAGAVPVLISFLICCVFVAAQSTGGRILGRVSDSSGAVLSGVKVTATNEATGVTHQSVTNDSGDYGFPQIPLGIYTLTFDLAGFKTNERKGIQVELNKVVTFNSTLEIGQTKEVVVSATAAGGAVAVGIEREHLLRQRRRRFCVREWGTRPGEQLQCEWRRCERSVCEFRRDSALAGRDCGIPGHY